jgi:hypothetical protein
MYRSEAGRVFGNGETVGKAVEGTEIGKRRIMAVTVNADSS